ncbi:MAG: hypothetical protein HY046_05510 [Acidobacteria bacterium]|nr:hypothetical protein [Acidobacteriota bacterium]
MAPKPPTAGELSPKAREALNRAQEALQKDDLKKAEEQLKLAQKLAPLNAQVFHLLGALALRRHEQDVALKMWKQAIALDPSLQEAHAAIGVILYRQKDYLGAKQELEQGLAGRQAHWIAHWSLASLYFEEKNYILTLQQAEKAIAASQGSVPEIILLRIRTLEDLGEKEKAEIEKESFLKKFPQHQEAAALQKELAAARAPKPDAPAVASPTTAAAPASPSVPAPTEEPFAAELPSNAWIPPDREDLHPGIASGVTCSLKTVLAGASRRVETLAKNLEQIEATETITHTELDRLGSTKWSRSKDFLYQISLRQLTKDTLDVTETRMGGESIDQFPSNSMTTGLFALAFVFHPFYSPDYAITCEGLGNWKGQPAWIVRFEQRPDRPARMHQFRNDSRGSTRVYAAGLKGRAWLAANNFQVLRLETELVAPIKPIKVFTELIRIEYGPVKFSKSKTTLWLPTRADFFADAYGRKFHQNYSLKNYQLFSVDANQKIADPKVP